MGVVMNSVRVGCATELRQMKERVLAGREEDEHHHRRHALPADVHIPRRFPLVDNRVYLRPWQLWLSFWGQAG